MSYEIANQKQSLGQFASNKGFTDFTNAVRSYPALKAFVSSGETTNVDAVRKELAVLIKKATPDISDIAKTLAHHLVGQTYVLITDGTSE